ncbi:hypothetical protein [Aquimarina spongiae]|nr:hypothetical protein [Aquimarina spongiae]
MKTKHHARIGRVFNDLKNYPGGSKNRSNQTSLVGFNTSLKTNHSSESSFSER